MNLKKIFSTLAVASMLVACGGNDTSSGNTSFKIGTSGPLTGDNAVYGNAVKNAVELAVEEVNAKGDIKLEFKMEDDQADPEKAPTAYGTLKDWGMQIGLATVTSGAGAAVSQNYTDDETFALTPSSSSTTVIYSDADNTQSYKYVYQMCFTDPNQGLASADYLKEHTELGTKVAVIYKSDDNYSTGIYQKFVSEAKKVGLDVVSETSFDNSSATDFNVQLKDAQSKGADIVYLPIYYQPASLILTQANQMGYQPTFFGVDGMDGILTLDGFDTKLAEGVYLLTPFSADATDELTANFVKNYKEKYGETPNQFAADAYDSIYAIYNALEAGKATPDMTNSELADILIKQFTTMTFDGITGNNVTWSENGEVSKSPKAVMIKDGVYVGVED
ncbi:ABC transporter substrate-binding protein [Allocoprobacillus halotolerans]|uniref:ABC transporter substrate-binding protein n=1 Tax=Allocoprobacillus halotolerans TaxID=2944914 RepID=A0ABY5I0Q2_9FIRM|nr:ABC transporter substrate-binding protein [Allocoprobacillus halotolerans]UTY38901.1 ABC transporter substrate-binding protein [Allocoprobacillus halotolerans]